jgi:hypothetical protein
VSTSQHIYICYSREDTAIMQRVRTSLQRVGLKVWTGDNIEPGSDQWKKEIPRAIQNSSAILVLMSPAANHSEWITRELSVAKSLHIEILPLLVAGEVHQSLHPAVATMEYIDLRDDYEKGMVQVIRLCYEYRQQVDLRTTMELRVAMDTETPEEAAQDEVVTPETANQEVKLFVSRVAARDEVSKPDKRRSNLNKPKPKSKTEPEPSAEPSRLRLLFGIGLLVVGLIAAVVVAILMLNPLGSDTALTEVVTVDTTAESTEGVETTAESQADVPTATTEPSSTPEPTATRVLPTTAPTSVPQNQAVTVALTVVPPTIAPTEIPASPTLVPATDIPAATAIPAVTDGNIEIRYNDDTIVVHNISDDDVNLSGVAFVLVGADAANSVLFLAEEWGMTNNILGNNRCAQIWRVEFAEMPVSEPPANECGGRSAFRSTPRTFWIADGDRTIFELRRNNEVLAQCEAALRSNNTILTCMADV